MWSLTKQMFALLSMTATKVWSSCDCIVNVCKMSNLWKCKESNWKIMSWRQQKNTQSALVFVSCVLGEAQSWKRKLR